MVGKSPVTAGAEERLALEALAASRDRGEADRARAVLLTLAGWTSARIGECTAPGSLDNRLRYAARLKVCSCDAARMPSGLRWPFFSISHSAL